MKRMDYSYQDKAAQEVLKNALCREYLASVLAAAPGAGKTTISHKIINNYLRLFPNAKVVVLTEGQNVLKNQYLTELFSPKVNISFTFGPFGFGSQVQVGLPQSIQQTKLSKIDLLIVDECHNFYMAPMIQNIIQTYKPTHQVLLTGSPTKYNAWNKANNKQYAIYYVSVEDLRDYGVFSAANMDVAKVSDTNNPILSIEQALRHAQNSGDDLSKIMVACPSIEYARAVAKFLSKTRSVSLSTSEDDKDNESLQAFKDGKTNTLVVVEKGILGFNDPLITTLIDLRSTRNVDASYQLFARILRIHPNQIIKSYIRVAEQKHYNREVMMLHKMHALMSREVFMGFTGNNLTIERVA